MQHSRVPKRLRLLALLLIAVSSITLAKDNEPVVTASELKTAAPGIKSTGLTDEEIAAKAKTLKGYDPDGGKGRKVFEVPIEGTIDLGLAPFIERIVEEAAPGDIIFIRMNTFGGRVDGAVRMRDALLRAKSTSVIFVEGRAISAGALIALACDTIIMNPAATIGDAMPVRMGEDGDAKATSEKAISYMREEMAATAKANGRSDDIARAMVDPDVEIEGLIAKDKLLTLTADKAYELGIADLLIDDFDKAVAALNLMGAQRVDMHTTWAEWLARRLTDPIISSLLMSLGMILLMIDIYTQGFGVKGVLGLFCLALFFLGQYTAHLAGWEELLLLTVGLVLLGVEIFVLPGFGVAGVAGAIAVGAAVVMALVELNLPLDVAMDLGYVQDAIQQAAVRIAILLVLGIGLTVMMARYLPTSRFGRHIILAGATTIEDGYVSQSEKAEDLVGKTGVATGDLRPAGIAEIDGKRIDVVSQGDYIKRGTEIRITNVDGNRVVVTKVS